MISIVIPRHNEPLDTVHPLLSSLDNQLGIDFGEIEIIISNDGETCLSDFCRYKNIARLIRNVTSVQESQIGLNRQSGLDAAGGEYVMFCDCDDMLGSPLALHQILNQIKFDRNKGLIADIYHLHTVQEAFIKSTGTYAFTDMEANFTWVFGKLYRINFLREHNIRFSPYTKWHEDVFFNCCMEMYDPLNCEMSGNIHYIWRWSEHTITRGHDHEYHWAGMCEFINARDLGLCFLTERGAKAETIENQKIESVCIFYWFVQSDNPRMNPYRETIEQTIAKYIKKHGVVSLCSEGRVKNILQENLHGSNTEKSAARETFHGFLNRMQKLSNI